MLSFQIINKPTSTHSTLRKFLNVATFSLASSLIFTHNTFAHGYLEGERGDLCRQGINLNCSNVDPADTEHPGTFPVGGAADGQLGSAGRPYAVLDEQSATRWYKHGISSGSHDFHWIIPAQHVSDNYRYYITKPDWNPNAPLTRSSFELTPFCQVFDGGKAPGNPTHNCNIPQRSGYHVILALWQVSYTGAEFYSLLDANFDGNSIPGGGGDNGGGDTGGGDNGGGDNGGGDNEQCQAPLWSSDTVYVRGETVFYGGNVWEAGWYHSGQTPGATGQWGVWTQVGPCH
ncbi:MAG TPA: lytic polysaccharide monooxygenase [Cellvibrio sp.]